MMTIKGGVPDAQVIDFSISHSYHSVTSSTTHSTTHPSSTHSSCYVTVITPWLCPRGRASGRQAVTTSWEGEVSSGGPQAPPKGNGLVRESSDDPCALPKWKGWRRANSDPLDLSEGKDQGRANSNQSPRGIIWGVV